jgi:chromosome segregation ATPase
MLRLTSRRRRTLAGDQELLTVVERRFAELAESIDDSRRETRERFDKVDQRFDQVDQRFDQVDQRFEQVDQRFEQVDQRFDRLEADIRHAHVRIESLEGVVQQVAEGVAGVDERLERFQAEVRDEFQKVRGELRQSYRQLDQRVTALEAR